MHYKLISPKMAQLIIAVATSVLLISITGRLVDRRCQNCCKSKLWICQDVQHVRVPTPITTKQDHHTSKEWNDLSHTKRLSWINRIYSGFSTILRFLEIFDSLCPAVSISRCFQSKEHGQPAIPPVSSFVKESSGLHRSHQTWAFRPVVSNL